MWKGLKSDRASNMSEMVLNKSRRILNISGRVLNMLGGGTKTWQESSQKSQEVSEIVQKNFTYVVSKSP